MLRIDDVGASSKRWERHRGKWFPYREMSAAEVDALVDRLVETGSTATVAVTACWVERDGRLVPFGRKFPQQRVAWAIAAQRGVIEVAAHGLTHCIPGRHVPSWVPWRGNRQWHREFIPALDFEVQIRHMIRARWILEDAFGVPVTTLVPPGNAISERAAKAALEAGYERVTCRNPLRLRYVQDDLDQRVLHDYDLIRGGVSVLGADRWCTVAEGARVGVAR